VIADVRFDGSARTVKELLEHQAAFGIRARGNELVISSESAAGAALLTGPNGARMDDLLRRTATLDLHAGARELRGLTLTTDSHGYAAAALAERVAEGADPATAAKGAQQLHDFLAGSGGMYRNGRIILDPGSSASVQRHVAGEALGSTQTGTLAHVIRHERSHGIHHRPPGSEGWIQWLDEAIADFQAGEPEVIRATARHLGLPDNKVHVSYAGYPQGVAALNEFLRLAGHRVDDAPGREAAWQLLQSTPDLRVLTREIAERIVEHNGLEARLTDGIARIVESGGAERARKLREAMPALRA
jgi:hypothetical protein